MSQASTWGVPRNASEQDASEEQFAVRADESLDALLSSHKGNSAPSYAQAGTQWIDDTGTPWIVKMYDGADWIVTGWLNATTNQFTPAGAALKGQIAGLTISNNSTDATNDIDIAAGECASEATIPLLMSYAGSTGIQLDVAYGTGSGGRFDSAISNGAWHVFIISNGTTVGRGLSKSLNPTGEPNYPAGYSHYRRIGSVIRASSALIGFTQVGDDFLLNVPVLDANAVSGPGTAAVLLALTVPFGIKVIANVTVSYVDTSPVGGTAVLVTSPDQTNTAPDFASRLGNVWGSAAAGDGSNDLQVRTNTSQQIRYRFSQSTADHFLYVLTNGWTDTRGR